MTSSLLPPNATPLERALEQVMHEPGRLPVPIAKLWNSAKCPVDLLPWLAWSISVDEWDATWPEVVKRDTLAVTPMILARKGTPWAIKEVLRTYGHPDAELIERVDSQRHDGSIMRDGKHRRGGGKRWATFRIVLKRPITIDQAQQLLRRIDIVKRKCCHLVDLDYTRAALRHNGFATRNGEYTRGVV
ncbi:phage tail protein I [Burkholderia ambifaria]|uniref:phage tail protein I n=1 Tax=Burkholderia ambifaria TaxID=152480 RepID=UPI001589FD5B|nr:phage tail protein I [Burkholderia ambifaria]